MPQQKVLIIEDDPNLVRILELELQHEGYVVEKEYDGLFGLRRAQEEVFDLILLDIMLPAVNGLEVLRRLRPACQAPVILLTARDAVTDKVNGLDSGAVDYVTKPFAIEELLARMRAALKKNMTADYSLLQIGELHIDKSSMQVGYKAEPILLTKREFSLLVYLVEHKDIVCSREQLIEQVWDYNFQGQTNLVDVYIRYLRSKIDYRFQKKIIQTIRGVGYIIRDET